MPTHNEERDALSPRKASVRIFTDQYPEGYDLVLPRLNMRRTLRLSQLVEDLNQDSAFNEKLMKVMDGFSNAGAENSGFQTIITLNSLFASVKEDQLNELFEIVTGKDAVWLEDNLEPGWAIEALKMAFEQQGFRKLFQGSTDTGTAGENGVGKSEVEVSQPQSISYNRATAGQTT